VKVESARVLMSEKMAVMARGMIPRSTYRSAPPATTQCRQPSLMTAPCARPESAEEREGV